MHIKQSRLGLFVLLLSLVVIIGFGPLDASAAIQTPLVEPFDNNSQFSTSTPFFSDGGGDYFGISDGAGGGDFGGGTIPTGLKAYTGFTGSFLAGMDLDGEGASLPITAEWVGIDISGLSSLEFSGDFAEFFDDPGDIDSPDFILVEYQIDGSGYQNLLSFRLDENEPDTFNGVFREDTDFNGTGDGTVLGDAAQTFTKAIVGTGTTLDLRLTVSVDSGDEDFGVDNFQVSGDDSGEPADPELLLTEIVVTPTEGEFIEIFNATSDPIDLSDFYLTDATYASGGAFYYNIVTGADAGGGDFSDFHARFPDGATIAGGEYQTIALAGSDNYFATYGIDPTYELFEDGASADGILDMREALPGSINNQGGLSNGGEVVILYQWDGASDLVLDMDYVVWGDKAEGVDKTGVSVDGPDADTDASAYLDDTAVASQDIVADSGHVTGNSWQREDLAEGAEIATGGNGVNGEDETSEDLTNTWCDNPVTPGAANDCTPPPPPPGTWIFNEINADPDSVNGDANGDGVVDTTQDEFVEIYNNSGGDVDISGWTLADGYSVRHTFPTDTIVPDGCAVVVFAGGTPTGGFGGSVVQTASSGALGLNNSGDTVTLNDGVNDLGVQGYGGEGGDNQSLTLDPDITGAPPLVRHSTASISGGALFSPGTLMDGSAFAGCATGPTEVKIHEIQGAGLASPLVGQFVTIEGVVVGDFQDVGQFGGFHVQEEDADADADPATSEGIFVYHYSTAVSVGDIVQVTGTVAEYNDLTEITNVTEVIIIGSGGSVTPSAVTLPVTTLDDLEAYEGMLVTFPQDLYISEFFNFDRYNEIVLTADRQFQPTATFDPGTPESAAQADVNLRSRIKLDDGRNGSNLDPALHPNGAEFTLTNTFRGGDILQNVTGVMDYAFGSYKIQPTQGASHVPQNLRTEMPDGVGGTMKVASFNVLNYFATLDDGVNDICGPLQNLECRGADTPEEFQRQRDKIFSALAAIDADVVGLIEIENHIDDVAVQDLVTGLNEHLGAETYAYIATGPIGTDAIKQAFIYKPASVTPVGDYAVLDDPSFINPNTTDPKNRPALAQTFYDRYTGGHVTIVVNHLKSKGSPCGEGDDDPEAASCNLTRTMAAQVLVDWLATDPTGSGDPDFLVIGDLNAYDKEDPIDAILAGADDTLGSGDDFADLVFNFVGEFAYSYVFDGQLGYLDHGLANVDLLPQVTGTTIWHINSDEPDIIDYDMTYKEDAQDALWEPHAYRSSDHDPVVIGLQLEPEGLIVNDNGCYVIGIETTPYEYAYNLVTTESRSLKYFRRGSRNYLFKAIYWAKEQGLPLNSCFEIHGTNEKDMIMAGFAADEIFGYDRRDFLFGRNGDDLFTGGDGSDYLFGGSGYDTVLDYDSGDRCISIEEGCPPRH